MGSTHADASPRVDADVIVVGAGPVGLVTSLMLAKRGWQVICLERWPQAYPRPRAVGFDDEAARILQDVGVIDDVNAVSNPGGHLYTWRNADDDTLLLIDNRGIGRCGWPRRTMFTQPLLEEVLRRHVDTHPRISLRSGVEVTAVSQDVDRATVDIRAYADPGATGHVSARYVVGCDGANSIVRAHMSTETIDLGYFFDWLILDVIPHEPRQWDPPSLQLCDPRRPATIIPGGPGRRRWEFMVLPGEDPAALNTEEAAWEFLRPWNLDPTTATLERHTIYRFQARWESRWNDGRLLLAGDSAHLMPPFAGQGFCSGMRDAANLTWKLDRVLRGTSSPQLLDSYTQERSEHVQFAIHFSIALGQVICVLDPDEAAERDARMSALDGDPAQVLPPLPDDAFTRGVIRPLPTGRVDPVAGRLSPQFAATLEGRTDLLDSLLGCSSALLVACDSIEPGARAVEPEDVDLLRQAGCTVVLLTAQVDHTGAYRAELERLGLTAILTRPDGICFGSAASLDDVSALVHDYVHALEGVPA